MNTDTLIGLINNAALLLAMGLLYDLFARRTQGGQSLRRQIISGVGMGVITLALMLTPWVFMPGIIFDARSIALSVGGFFFGAIPTFVAAILASVYRIYLGGAGAVPGVGVIMTSAAIGVVWRQLRKRWFDEVTLQELYLFGVAVHINMLIWMLTLPQPTAFEVLTQIGLPVMLIFPLGTLLLGWLMVNQERRWETQEALAENIQLLQETLEQTHRLQQTIDSLNRAHSLEEVYAIAAEGIIRILRADRSAILLFDDDDKVHFKAWKNLSPEYRKLVEGHSPWLRDEIDAQPLCFADVSKSGLDQRLIDAVQKEGISALVFMPLKGPDRLLGKFMVYFDDPHPISEQEVNLAQVFAQNLAAIILRRQAWEESQQIALKYRSIFENAAEGIYQSTPQGRLLTVNPAMVKMFGYRDEDEMLALEDTSHLYWDQEERTRLVGLLDDAGQLANVEVKMKRRDGTPIWVLINTRAVKDEQGRTVYYEGALLDITERKAAERELRRNARNFEALYEIARDLAGTTNLSGLLKTITERARELFDIDVSGIYLYDSEQNELVMSAVSGYPVPVGTRLRVGEGMAGRVAQTREPLIIEDYRSWSGRASRYDGIPFTSVLEVPMLYAGELVGVLVVNELAPKRRTFSEADVRLLSLLAASAAGAVHTTRLYEAEKRRVAELGMLFQVSQSLAQVSFDPEEIALIAAQQFVHVLGFSECSVSLWVPDEKILKTLVDIYVEDGQERTRWDWVGKIVHLADYPATTRVLETLQPLVVRADDADADAAELAYMHSVGSETLVILPLAVKGEAVGIIELETKEKGRTYSAKEIELAMILANQTAVALDNARLFKAERAAREQAETLRVATQAISATLDLQCVFELILSELRRVVPYDSASVQLLKDERLVIIGGLGFPNPDEVLGLSFDLTVNDAPNAQVVRTRRPFIVMDAPERYPEFRRDPHAAAGIRSWLGAPLLFGDRVIGVITLDKREPGFYNEQHAQMVQAFAAQAAIAIEHARLFEELQHRVLELTTLFEVNQALTTSLQVEDVQDFIVEATAQTLQAEGGYLFLWDETEEQLVLHAATGLPIEKVGCMKYQPGEGLVGWVFAEGQIANASELNKGQRRGREPGREAQDEATTAINALMAPLRVGEKTLGVLGVVNKVGAAAFSASDESLLTTLAGQVAVTIENARLYRELQEYASHLERRVAERTAELEAAYRQLRQAHEEMSQALERERELNELKTRFVSTVSHEFRTPLTTILSSAELLEHYGRLWPEEKRLTHLHRIQSTVQRMTDLLDEVLQISRADAGRLRFSPHPLDLVSLCSELIEDFGLNAGSQHDLILDLSGLEDPESLPAMMDEQLLRRILTNLLSNAIKYSPAGQPVRLSLRQNRDRVCIIVEDRGLGIPERDQARLFEPFHRGGNVDAIPGTGLGLHIVKRAVERHGGVIRLESEEDVGTTVTVELPLNPP